MTEPAPQTPAPEATPSEPAKPSLEDSLAALDDQTREFIIGEVRTARTEAQNLRSRLKEAEPKLTEYDALVEASKSDLERANESVARWQSEAEKWRGSAVASKITALATDFADPSDATTALSDPAKYLGADGQINEQAIRADLDEVLTRKPHWRRADTPAARVPAPNRAQGTSATPPAADPASEFASIIQGRLHGSA